MREIAIFTGGRHQLRIAAGTKHALLLAGVGWGNMPEPNARADLETGCLVRFDLAEARSEFYSLPCSRVVDSALC